MVLIFISPVISDVEHYFIFFGHLHDFLEETLLCSSISGVCYCYY